MANKKKKNPIFDEIVSDEIIKEDIQETEKPEETNEVIEASNDSKELNDVTNLQNKIADYIEEIEKKDQKIKDLEDTVQSLIKKIENNDISLKAKLMSAPAPASNEQTENKGPTSPLSQLAANRMKKLQSLKNQFNEKMNRFKTGIPRGKSGDGYNSWN